MSDGAQTTRYFSTACFSLAGRTGLMQVPAPCKVAQANELQLRLSTFRLERIPLFITLPPRRLYPANCNLLHRVHYFDMTTPDLRSTWLCYRKPTMVLTLSHSMPSSRYSLKRAQLLPAQPKASSVKALSMILRLLCRCSLRTCIHVSAFSKTGRWLEVWRWLFTVMVT